MATIDSYLDELLGGEAPPPAPRSMQADAMATSAEAADVDGDPPTANVAANPDADDAARMAQLAADLMAELLADPALSDATPIAAPAARSIVAHADVTPIATGDGAPTRRSAPLPPAPRTATAPVVEAAPAFMRAPAMPDLSAFLPPTGGSISPVPRVPVAASAARTRTATGGHRWLRVCVGGDSYAFELLRVQEVVRLAPVVAMRGAGHAVLGVMNLRGRIVPVFDLGLWLDVGAVHADERSRIVVVERNDELIGVLVTAVEDVVSLEREHVEPPLLGADPGPTLGVARVTAAPTVLLDADALFD